MQGYVSDQNLAVSRRQYDQNWRLFTAKFWSLTFSPSQILVTDVYSKPNCGHTDVSWATCIMRIFAVESYLKLEKSSAAFFTPFPMLRGVQSLVYQFFSDHGWVPLRLSDILLYTSFRKEELKSNCSNLLSEQICQRRLYKGVHEGGGKKGGGFWSLHSSTWNWDHFWSFAKRLINIW